MNVLLRSASALLLVALASSPLLAAETPSVCSTDTLSVDGKPITITLCAPSSVAKRAVAGKPTTVAVAETFATHDASFTRTASLDFLTSAEISRTIDDVPLAKLGSTKSLHLTIAYRPGNVRLEHALLVPGAISLK